MKPSIPVCHGIQTDKARTGTTLLGTAAFGPCENMIELVFFLSLWPSLERGGEKMRQSVFNIWPGQPRPWLWRRKERNVLDGVVLKTQ